MATEGEVGELLGFSFLLEKSEKGVKSWVVISGKSGGAT